MGFLLLSAGLLLALVGGAMMFLERFGFPKLPGDIFIQKGNFTFYFPLVSMLLVSIVATIIVNLFRR